MLRTAFCATSLLVLSTPALADEPAFDFTLAVHSNMVADSSLAFEFRVDDHFAWFFDVGAAYDTDAIGFTAGAGLKYFVAEDFEGFYLGFGGSSAALVDDAGDEVVSRTLVNGYFGHKWIWGPGFTVDVNVGPTIIVAEDASEVGDDIVVTSEVQAGLNAQLSLGWSF